MRKIPAKLRKEILADPFYKTCSLSFLGGCGGGVTWEHSIIYQGRQLNEKWAIIPLCEAHHGVNNYQDVTALDKERSEWVALNRATDADLFAVSKVIDYQHKKKYLNNKYGKYNK